MANEHYFRAHPELMGLTGLFIRKILDDRPENILQYAGQFFDRAELRDIVMESIGREKELEERNKYLSDLISGKTLIEWEAIVDKTRVKYPIIIRLLATQKSLIKFLLFYP